MTDTTTERADDRPTAPTDFVELRSVQRKLLRIWGCGAGTIFVLVVVQSILGTYGEKVQDAWSWLLPNIMPSLTLMLGVLFDDARAGVRAPKRADPLASRWTVRLSIFYLVLVLASIVLAPLSPSTPLELMSMSSFWLAPAQGLVGASIGVFFVRRAKDEPGEERDAEAGPG